MRWPNTGEKRDFQTPAHFNKVNKDSRSHHLQIVPQLCFKPYQSLHKHSGPLSQIHTRAEAVPDLPKFPFKVLNALGRRSAYWRLGELIGSSAPGLPKRNTSKEMQWISWISFTPTLSTMPHQ